MEEGETEEEAGEGERGGRGKEEGEEGGAVPCDCLPVPQQVADHPLEGPWSTVLCFLQAKLTTRDPTPPRGVFGHLRLGSGKIVRDVGCRGGGIARSRTSSAGKAARR